MKRCSFKLLGALLALSAAQIQAVRYTNKTHGSFRPHGVQLAMEKAMMHTLETSPAKNAWLGKVQATGFFQRSENKRDLARLFLFNNKDAVKLQYSTTSPLAAGADHSLGYFVHDYLNPNDNRNATLKLAPERSAYGVSVGYQHDLSRLVNGLHFSISAPLTVIQTRMNMVVTSADAALQENVEKYFSGRAVNVANNSQAQLANAVIADQRAVGVADVELELNYDVVTRPWGSFSLGLGGTLPTGNRPDGKFMFQPICGNGHHFGLGAQAGLNVELFEHKNHRLAFLSNARYRYLFESNQVRTLGIIDGTFSQYVLLGKIGTAANTPLVPAANVTTLAVDVTPGHQADMTAGLSYTWRTFTIDAGYNLFYRHAENVKLRNNFTDNGFMVAKTNFNTNNVFSSSNGMFEIKQAYLDIESAASNTVLSHSIYTSVGMTHNANGTPLMLSVGGSYEFAGANNSLEQWTAWAKAGISF